MRGHLMSDQLETAAAMMVRDYLILAFLVSLGALQIAVTISGIRGLWLIPNRTLTRSLGIVLIAIGFAYYIFSPIWIEGPWAAGSVVDGTSENRQLGTAALSEVSGARNLNDIHGGMAGTAYAVYFVLSAVLATIFAAIIGTINLRKFPSPSRSEGDAANSSPFSKGRYRGVPQGEPEPADGLDALKINDPITTLKSSLSNLRKNASKDVRTELRSAHQWSIPSMIGRMRRN